MKKEVDGSFYVYLFNFMGMPPSVLFFLKLFIISEAVTG